MAPRTAVRPDVARRFAEIERRVTDQVLREEAQLFGRRAAPSTTGTPQGAAWRTWRGRVNVPPVPAAKAVLLADGEVLTAQAVEMLRISGATFARLLPRSMKPVRRIGRALVWKRSDVELLYRSRYPESVAASAPVDMSVTSE
jgi:hypothetical protein